MNTNKQKFSIVIVLLIDAAVAFLAYYISFLLQFSREGTTVAADYRILSFIIVAIYLVASAFFGLYRPFRMTGRKKEALRIGEANVVTALVMFTVLYLLYSKAGYTWTINFSRRMAAFFVVVNTLLQILWRNVIRLIILAIGRSSFNRKPILIVGCSRAAASYIERVATHRQWGYEIIGLLDDKVKPGEYFSGVKVLGKVSELEQVLDENKAESIIITLDLAEYSRLPEIVHICEKSGVHTEFVPDYSDIISTRPYTEDFLGLPLIHIRHVPLMESGWSMLKRLMDIIGSIICIILFSPVMLVTAIAVKVSSPGEIIFRQERVGLHNKTFNMYKFRSMAVQKASDEVDKWTTKGDMRVTGVGKIIRKTSIDELPQLFNVLKGDMSLVGPRPERPFFVEKFKEEIPRYRIKHQVRPGMTGWAQVNGLRGDTSIRRRIELDLYYIENWSIWFDFRILFLTVFKGFINKNAY